MTRERERFDRRDDATAVLDHAAAAVDQQPDGRRCVLLGEEADLLRPSFFEYPERLLRKPPDEPAAAIRDGDVEDDEIGMSGEVRSVLRDDRRDTRYRKSSDHQDRSSHGVPLLGLNHDPRRAWRVALHARRGRLISISKGCADEPGIVTTCAAASRRSQQWQCRPGA